MFAIIPARFSGVSNVLRNCTHIMDVIDANYENAISTPSDIWEHLPLMCKYSMQCDSIVEVGVRSIVSTWAFVKGLAHNGKQKKELICIDVDDVPPIETVIAISAAANISVKFIRGDSATIDFRASSRPFPGVRATEDEYDMMFIDSWHVGAHLERELSSHAHKIKLYIMMHDTESDGLSGESVRCGYNVAQQAKQYGYSEASIRTGLVEIIDRFLKENPDWELKERFKHNNGLTILRRKT